MAILRHLGPDECCVCELVEALEVRQSLLSFHLAILKEAGLVRDRRVGRWSFYAVNADAIRELGTLVSGLANPERHRKRRSCSTESASLRAQ